MKNKDDRSEDAFPLESSGQELRRQAEEIAREKAAQSRENHEAEALLPKKTRQMLHELRVHQIELEMQNEELKRTQLELGVARTRYFELYDLAPVGYCTVSEMGLILEANLTAATLLDVSRSKLIKQPFGRIIISIGALTALAVVILAVFISRTLTRPIRILVEGAEEIGRGNLDHIVGTTTPDEIGELSRTFDRMTQALKKTTVSRDALQQKKHFSDTVIDSFPGIFYLFDEKGRFIYALDGANRMQQLIQDLLT